MVRPPGTTTTTTTTTNLFTAPQSNPSPPSPSRPISILILNPNSTPSMTAACIASVLPTLAQDVSVTGFTAPHPSPSAIESATDAILSAEACIRALTGSVTLAPAAAAAAASNPDHPTSPNPSASASTANNTNNNIEESFSAILVACYSAHPLIPSLRELFSLPVVGIMEASIYAARMLGGRFGIVATGERSRIMQEDAVRATYGLGASAFFVGSEATGLGVLELEGGEKGKLKEEVLATVGKAAERLVAGKGADLVCLGCAGMTDMVRACEDAVGGGGGGGGGERGGAAEVVDGVVVGVGFLVALVRAGLGTAKAGVYRSAHDSRIKRGQDWI